MKRRIATILVAVFALTLIGGATAFAHECNDPEETDCHTTPVVSDWRAGNYFPLFDIDRDCDVPTDADGDDPNEANCEDTVGHDSDGDGDIDGDDARYDGQRWRDECAQPDGEANQFCIWADFGNSIMSDGDEDPEPNEIHVGTAGSHCFLGEFAHQCEDHYRPGSDPTKDCSDYPPGKCPSEGVHDAHGGAVYIDLCLAKNADSKWCDDGLEDTQVGLTVMDHNDCGLPVPIVACIDEYHVIRPFDQTYTDEQMSDSQEYATFISENPGTYVCGKPGFPDYTDGACHDAFDQLP